MIWQHHPVPKRKACTLFESEPIQHSKQQQLTEIDNSAPLSAREIKELQLKLGTVFYCGHMIDLTSLVSINDMSIKQSKATTNTNKKQTICSTISTPTP